MAARNFLPKGRPLVSGIGAVGVAGLGAFALYAYYSANRPVDPTKPQAVFASAGPKTLRLESVQQVNHNTKRLRFALPKSIDHSGLALTSAVLTITWPEGKILPTLRPYTPITHADDPGHMDLLVKKYPNGKGSGYLHSLSPGQTLTFATAIRGYAWTPNQHARVALVAGGAGITPAFQLAQGILRNPADQTKIDLVFGVNTDADLVLKQELDALEREHPGRLRVTYAVSKPAEGSPHRRGYVTEELLREVIGEARAGEDTKVFVCGPPAMEAALTGKGRGFGKGSGILEQLGYTPAQIHKF